MRIHVHVVPGAKQQSVEKQGTDIYGHDVYRIRVSAKPVEGEATKAVLKAVAEHFQVALRHVSLISGSTSREKIVEITGL